MQANTQQLLKMLSDTVTDNLIIANGLFPTNELIINLIKKAKLIITCDGNKITQLESYQRTPDYIVGDCDSLESKYRLKYANKIRYKPAQDINDLTKAILFSANELGLNDILILGATGKREDHSLANISILAKYSEHLNITMISDYGVFSMHRNTSTITSIPGQQISLFAIDNTTQVSSTRLKWELNNLKLSNWYSASLNQAIDDSFSLTSNKPIIVYRCFELKLT